MFRDTSPHRHLNIIQPLPRFYTLRIGRRSDVQNPDEQRRQRVYPPVRPRERLATEEIDSSAVITGIRNRDWNFYDDPRDMSNPDALSIKYQLVPSMSNTMKNRSMNVHIASNANQYEEYDLDEQDFQWLIAYNQFRIEKHLPELDENIFEYIMQLLEQQCSVAIRRKNYEDTIECDACHRIDDVDDLIQCVQCQTIVHKKCYGIDDENTHQWICRSCEENDHCQHVCCLCEQSGGALKVFQSITMQQWVHLSCAFWLSTVEFDERMRPILIARPQSDGRCVTCQKNTGMTINCSWKNCLNRFHALCAIHAGHDMFVAESDDKSSVGLLALCQQHSEKMDVSEKRTQTKKSLENTQKRFEQFASYINIEVIKNQSLVLPDVVESIHTYWLLKRQANNGRPLTSIPDDILFHDYDRNIDLVEFARRYHSEQRNPTEHPSEDKLNLFQFFRTNTQASLTPSNSNLFVKFARQNRRHFMDYERNLFCLLDLDKKKRDGVL